MQGAQFVTDHIDPRRSPLGHAKIVRDGYALVRFHRHGDRPGPRARPRITVPQLNIYHRARRSRLWRGDHRTCSSKSPRESDRGAAEGETGFSGGQVAQSRYGAVWRYRQGDIDLAPVAGAPGAFKYLPHVQKRAE